MIPIVVARHWRGVGAAGSVHDRQRLEGGRQHPIGVAEYDLWWNDLFRGVDDAMRSQCGFFTDAQPAPDVRASLGIGALHMDDGDVGAERGNQQVRRPIERRGRRPEVRMVA